MFSQHTHAQKLCEFMEELTNPIVVMIFQDIHVCNHYIVLLNLQLYVSCTQNKKNI